MGITAQVMFYLLQFLGVEGRVRPVGLCFLYLCVRGLLHCEFLIEESFCAVAEEKVRFIL